MYLTFGLLIIHPAFQKDKYEIEITNIYSRCQKLFYRHPSMAKRKREEVEDTSVVLRQPFTSKRFRPTFPDRLSNLSDELVIRVLSFLNVADLITIQRWVCVNAAIFQADGSRLSHRLSRLATDSQLWKALYYAQFVRQRAARIPGISSSSLVFSSKASKWLEEQHLVRSGARTNWKAQYKLRFNWTNGSSRVSELHLKDHLPPVPPLVRMKGDCAISVDTNGLRIWTLQGHRQLLATHSLQRKPGRETAKVIPCSIAIDDGVKDDSPINIAVGFEDGFGVFSTSRGGDLLQSYSHQASSNGAIVAIAFNHPYITTVSKNQMLSLYDLQSKGGELEAKSKPRLLSSLRSHTARAPLAISLRVLPTSIVASIAYVLPSYVTGWNVGLQELRFSLTGNITESRAEAAPTVTSYRSLSAAPGDGRSLDDTDGDESGADGSFWPGSSPLPTSLSYAHPYMLVSHPDNTLTLYLVHSTDQKLTISPGRRLWGHTSSVSDAQVGDRGRAISASASGDEIRVWELEEMMQTRKRALGYATSVPVRQRVPLHALEELRRHMPSIPHDHRVVGFDQQKVVMMREHQERTLVVYDFT